MGNIEIGKNKGLLINFLQYGKTSKAAITVSIDVCNNARNKLSIE